MQRDIGDVSTRGAKYFAQIPIKMTIFNDGHRIYGHNEIYGWYKLSLEKESAYFIILDSKRYFLHHVKISHPFPDTTLERQRFSGYMQEETRDHIRLLYRIISYRFGKPDLRVATRPPALIAEIRKDARFTIVDLYKKI